MTVTLKCYIDNHTDFYQSINKLLIYIKIELYVLKYLLYCSVIFNVSL